MEAVIRSKGIEYDGQVYALANVAGIIPTDAGVSVTMRSGQSFIVGDMDVLSTLTDMCPWAICGV